MSERASSWRRHGVWDGIASPGRFGADGREPGVVITPRHDFSLACVIGAHDDDRSLERVFAARYGIEPPRYATGRVRATSLDLIWSGPSQWLAVSVRPDMPAELAAGLAGVAAVTDQTDARAVLQLNGPHVREALAKGCPVDLHPTRVSPRRHHHHRDRRDRRSDLVGGCRRRSAPCGAAQHGGQLLVVAAAVRAGVRRRGSAAARAVSSCACRRRRPATQVRASRECGAPGRRTLHRRARDFR